VCALSVGSPHSIAQDAAGGGGVGFVGPAIALGFEVSEDYELVPGVVGLVQYAGFSAILTPSDLDIDLLSSERYTLGPSFSYRFERDDVENDQVDQLDDVDAALEAGVNFAINFASLLDDQDGLSLGVRFTQDLADGHGGFVALTSANYSFPMTDRLRLTGGLELTAVSDDYADAYFGVSATEALRSGLSAYNAEGGLKDAKLSLRADYALNETWGVGAYVSYARLMGDFADSSIVEEAGSENQLFGFVGFRFSF